MPLFDDIRETLSTAMDGVPLFLDLMLGPKDPPFSRDTDFKEHKIECLTVLVLAILLTTPTLFASQDTRTKFLPYFRNIVVALLLLTLLYMALGRVFRIRMKPGQIFYCFCLLAAPWVVILAFWLWLGVSLGAESSMGPYIFFVIGPWLIVIVAASNIARGIRRISGCPLWRALVSMLIFLVAFVVVMIWIL